MSKEVKIIHLSSASLGIKPQHHPKSDEDSYFVASWAGLMARRLKKFNPELDIEVWRTERDCHTIREKEVYNIWAIIWPYQLPIVRNALTYKMIKRLNYLKRHYCLIVHFHDVFNLRFVLLTLIFCSGIKLVLSNHGGVPPRRKSLKDLLIRLLYRSSMLVHITYLSGITKDYFSSFLDMGKMTFLPVGADFEMKKPGNKKEARESLGLDFNRVYALYVGRFYRLKGVDLILDVYRAFKDRYNFSVIFVGGSNDDVNDLYTEVTESGCPWFGVQYPSEMEKFFNASDFYIHPAFHSSFGGLDVSWIESCACNRPVISPQLQFLDFNTTKLGITLKSKEEVLDRTEWMIRNFSSFSECRSLAKEYLDGNNSIMKKLDRIYRICQ